MARSLVDLFRLLSSFSPPRADLHNAPWDEYVDWAISQGLGPLAAYNIEYRLGSAGVPDWAHDRLLTVYQGAANDNVMKLVNFKRAVSDLEGRHVVVIGAISSADSLYPHVAFRPVDEIRVFIDPREIDPFARFLAQSDFKQIDAAPESSAADRLLSDDRTTILLYGQLIGDPAEDEGLRVRSLAHRAYGPSIRRLDLEDAFLTSVLLMGKSGFAVPMIEFVDLREMLTGAESTGGVYSRQMDRHQVALRARRWNIERSLYAAGSIVEALFPETSEIVRALKPDLTLPTRELLERLVVRPMTEIGRTRGLRGAEAVRALLVG